MASNIAAQSDETLLALIAQGSHAAFSVLAQRHSTRFYAAAFALLQNREDAEDVVQAAFLKLWRQPGLWDPARGARFTTWFHRIVINAAVDLKRRHHARLEPIENASQVADNLPDPDEVIDGVDRKIRMNSALKSLPDHQRLALELCFYQGLSNQEAADAMGLHVKALQSLIMRAKGNLRSILLPDENNGRPHAQRGEVSS